MADGTALYVMGFPVGISESTVQDIFSSYGPVKSLRMLPTPEGKTDVAAIVTMENTEQATWLIENVSGKVPQGLTEPITIKKKREAQDWNKGMGKGWGGVPAWAMMWSFGKGGYGGYGGKGGWGKGGGGGGLASFPAERKVWLGDLPEGLTYKDLQAHFPGSKFATVMKGKGAGTGGVAYATAEEATEAIKTLNGSTLAGATIVVDIWTKKDATPAEPAAPAAAEA
jgi:RNA recognition motif-containing protein